jgi:hypothetical protein
MNRAPQLLKFVRMCRRHIPFCGEYTGIFGYIYGILYRHMGIIGIVQHSSHLVALAGMNTCQNELKNIYLDSSNLEDHDYALVA